MNFNGAARPLTREGIDAAASRLGVESAKVWAILAVETEGMGFLPWPSSWRQLVVERGPFGWWR